MDDMIQQMMPYGELPEDMEEDAHKMCKGKTVKELRQLGDYFHSKAFKLSQAAESTITMEQYDKILKTKHEGSDEQEGETYASY